MRALRRVAVVGSGGAGKTTFAKRLGKELEIPVIHLDEHYWGPGWVGTPREQWRERQRKLLDAERWIADGNYSSTLGLRIASADTVIVLALPRWRCLLRVSRRWLRHRGRDIQAVGCPERIDPTFLRWIWDYPTVGRARLDVALRDHAGPATTVIELSTPAEIRTFLVNARRLEIERHPSS